MKARLFDHLDLRVRDLKEADAFYQLILPPLGFPTRGTTPHCIYFEAAGNHPKPEFIALIEDKTHVPNASRIAFWCDTKEEVDAFAMVLARTAAQNIEGPMFCPEYSPTYYAIFFNDPSGNCLEACCRTASRKMADRLLQPHPPHAAFARGLSRNVSATPTSNSTPAVSNEES